MKKVLTILLISAILTGCGHISEDKPYVAEETTTVSQNAVTTASDAIITTTSAGTVTNEVTTKNSSQSVTDKTAAETTTAVANTDIQPKKEKQQFQNSQDNSGSEVNETESKTTTSVQISSQKVTTAPAVKESKTTTSPPVVTTKATQTTTPAKPVNTTPPITTTEIYIEPAKMNITEHWLIYFGDSHSKDYYVNVGRNLSNDGSDNSKAKAVFDYVTANFSNDNACTYLSAVTMCLCEGVGLDCGYVLISDWYAHCANAVNVDGTWYVLDTQAGGYLCGNFGFARILDEYENELSITLSNSDY